MIDIHNSVNKINNKKIYSYEESLKKILNLYEKKENDEHNDIILTILSVVFFFLFFLILLFKMRS